MATKDKSYYLAKLTSLTVADAKTSRIASASDLYPHVKHYAKADVEYFIVCTLSGAHKVLGIHEVSKGILNRTVVHPREVFRPAIRDNACAVIVCHNRPSGQLEWSDEDRNITRRLKDAGNILGITVLDHLLIAGEGYLADSQD